MKLKIKIMLYSELDTDEYINRIKRTANSLCKRGWKIERTWATTCDNAERSFKVRFSKKIKGQRGKIVEFKAANLSKEALNQLAAEITQNVDDQFTYLDCYLGSDRSENYTYNYKLYVLFLYK